MCVYLFKYVSSKESWFNVSEGEIWMVCLCYILSIKKGYLEIFGMSFRWSGILEFRNNFMIYNFKFCMCNITYKLSF